ncbi:MAG: hypothetical protein ACPKM0_03055 [Pleomorphochaeta sp.]
MFTNKDIIKLQIEDKNYSAITFSDKNCELPSFLLQGEKQPGFIYKDDKLEKWYWEGFTTYNDKKCLYFEPLELYPLAEIAFSKRNIAPKLILNLAKALSLLDSSFLDLQNGIISAWRIYFTKDDGILILPRTLSDIFSSTSNEKVRYDNANYFIHANLLPSFTLIDQMAQLYYFAMTSIRPYEFTTVRENKYNAINLDLLVNALDISVDSDLSNKIDKILHLSISKIRDISSNLEPQIALKWFIERFKDISWDLENKAYTKIDIETLLENDKISKTINNYLKNEKRRVFLRKRGTLIIIITLISIAVIGFTTSRIKEALAPPYTASFDQNGIINAYYEAQNNLDVQKLEASLKRGTKSPISNEITTLFVTRQTRMAYEQVDSVVNPVTWVEKGMPPINDQYLIYGIDDILITQINENQYKVDSIFYSPYPLNDEISEEEGIANEDDDFYYCYRFMQSEIFTFNYNDRGWYEISDIQQTNMKYVDTLLVPTFSSYDTEYIEEEDLRETKSIIEDIYLNATYN